MHFPFYITLHTFISMTSLLELSIAQPTECRMFFIYIALNSVSFGLDTWKQKFAFCWLHITVFQKWGHANFHYYVNNVMYIHMHILHVHTLLGDA